MDEQAAPPTYQGAIVLKARSAAETAVLAEQLRHYAQFGDVFVNRYEGGYAVKGQVYTSPPEGAPDHAALEVTIRNQAAQIGELERRIEELLREIRMLEWSRDHSEALLKLLSQAEYMRLIDRNITKEYPHLWAKEDAVEPDGNDAARGAFAAQLLEHAARRVETDGPDNTYVTLRAAEHCAALVRSLIPTNEGVQE